MSKGTDSKRWEALEHDALEAELEEVLAMSPQARRWELADAGFDLQKLDAEVAELRGDRAKSGRVIALRPRRARLAAWAAGVAAIAACGAVIGFQLLGPPPVAGDRPPYVPSAAVLRDAARSACGAGRWAECLDDLDRARTLDPEGDTAPAVQALRRQANDPK